MLLRRLGEAAYTQVLAEHHEIIRSSLAAHDGKEVGTQGDGFFAVFSSPRACAAAVIEMQRALEAHTWPDGEHIRVRMGVHSGEASETSTGLVGFDVHRAARVAAVAHGGQILLSETAAALVRDTLPAGASLRDLGLHRLKDLGRPEQILQLEAEGLPTEFPALRSLDNPALPNNLPAQSATFVGRDAEVADVRALVEAGRLVTLTGAGGSGKTRLALQVAADLLDGSGDGVWLVELAAVSDEEAVAPTIAEALGILAQPGRPPLETLLDALEPQRVLIVLDNCEHLIGVCAKVADIVLRRCPRVHLMTTSREPFGIGGEAIYRVPSLSLPGPDAQVSMHMGSDAVALFMERATAQGVDFALDHETAPLVGSICRRLDGMPLAIELAAARLRSMSLANLHDRLDQRFRLLTGGSRSALPRQQTLRATVEWSYSLLNGPEQSVLRRLSVFADGFDLAAAEAICGLGDIDVFDVTDILGSLVDKSLVVAEPTGGAVRYRLLETIRQFSAEHLVELDAEDASVVTDAHCAHYLLLAQQAAPHLLGPDQGQWLRRLEAEHANLRRAIEHATEDGDGTARVLEFAVALRRYWWIDPPEEETFARIMSVLERPEAQAFPRLLGWTLVTASFTVRNMNMERAGRLVGKAVEIARDIDDDHMLADALALQCAISYFSGNTDAGIAPGEEAVERARLLSDDSLLCQCLTMYLLCKELLDPHEAGRLFAEAVACGDRSGDLFAIAILQNNAGVHALQVGDTAAARSYLESADRARHAIGWDSHNVLVNLGWVLREEGDRPGALVMFEQALHSCRRSGERSGTGYSILGLACLATDEGAWSRAAVLHGAGQRLLDQNGQAWGEPEESYRRDSMDSARQRLGQDEFQRLYAQGTGLNFDGANALALSRGDGDEPRS